MKYDKDYLYNAYNATCTGDENDELETYENWLERQLIKRLQIIDELERKSNINDKRELLLSFAKWEYESAEFDDTNEELVDLFLKTQIND